MVPVACSVANRGVKKNIGAIFQSNHGSHCNIMLQAYLCLQILQAF